MDFLSIAFFELNLVYEETETKKAMGAWKPPMAFAFKSNHYSSTGQASFMFAQRHQLPRLVLKIFSTQILFFNIGFFLTNPRCICQGGLKLWLPGTLSPSHFRIQFLICEEIFLGSEKAAQGRG
jgi:hypothetical protein